MANPSLVRRFSLTILAWGVATTLLPYGLREARAKLPEFDAWDVVQIKGQRVGYAQTTLRLSEKSGRQVAKLRQVTKFSLQRFGQETSMKMDYSDTETQDGVLIDFELVILQGTTPMRTTGKVVGNRLELQIQSQGQKQNHSVAWPAGAGGLLGAELSIRAKPLEPGEQRTVEYLNMDNQACTGEMTAQKEEPVELLGGTFRLLKIDMVERMAPNAQGQRLAIQGTVWANTAGEVLKTWLKPMSMETLRVTREVALAKTPLAKLDLGETTLVKVDRAIPQAHDTKRVRYRIRLEDGDPIVAFPASLSQTVKRIDEHTAEVTVQAVRPRAGENKNAEKSAVPSGDGEADKSDLPTDADRKPNNFIQSDDPLIVDQAKEAAGDETDAWKVVVTLEAFVNRAVTTKDFSQALATASEVAQNREGDCKGHAVYLAALARARKIPARVAIGLVYMPRSHSFGYHMWTEVYVTGRWIGLDGTLANGGIGGGHLTLAHSPLAGVAAYNSFLPVMQVVGQLKVEVLDWE
ncbi:MAG: transglutaminase family protein [Thermoguttaceae bacterium]